MAYYGLRRRTDLCVFTNISEEHNASIFMVA